MANDSGYEQFLEGTLDQINKILARLLWAHAQGKSLDPILAEIEVWMGDDWWMELPEGQQELFFRHENDSQDKKCAAEPGG